MLSVVVSNGTSYEWRKVELCSLLITVGYRDILTLKHSSATRMVIVFRASHMLMVFRAFRKRNYVILPEIHFSSPPWLPN